jgi:hypothetical protein
MLKKDVFIIYTSKWEKENMYCFVSSRKKEGEKRSEFTFYGRSPFPCFNMESTFTLVSEWLSKNGWIKSGSSTVEYDNIVTNTETGEVVNSDTVVYRTRVVEKTVSQETISDLIKAGRRVDAIKLYRRATECSLKEAVDHINSVMEDLGLRGKVVGER